MRKIQPRKGHEKPKVRKLYSKPVLILLLIIAISLAKGSWNVYEKEYESRNNVAMVMKELQALEERKAVLVAETEKLDTEEGVEEAIRRKFQVSKDGESVLVVVDKPLPPALVEEEQGLLDKFWDSVSGIFGPEEE